MADPIALIVAATIVAGGALYLVVRAVMRKLQRRRHPRPESVQKAANVMDAMMELLDQQRSVSREITESLEKRIHELKELIERADETIGRLATRASTLTVVRPPAEIEAEDDETEVPVETGTSRAERTALFGSITAVSSANSPLPGSRMSADEKQRLVCEYADQGMNIHEIAREMQIGKGEVKLILSLRQGE
jgi:hypothetical protein